VSSAKVETLPGSKHPN